MIKEFRQITLIKIRKNPHKDTNQDLQIFSRALGMFGERDKEKSCYRVFIELVKSKKPIKSDTIAINANLSRATVIHHLNSLIESGIVKPEKNGYVLRVDKLKGLIHLLKRDVDEMFIELENIAKELDEELEL
jgi:predicted transcriptional regulator